MKDVNHDRYDIFFKNCLFKKIQSDRDIVFSVLTKDKIFYFSALSDAATEGIYVSAAAGAAHKIFLQFITEHPEELI
jgi:hypothetical protein